MLEFFRQRAVANRARVLAERGLGSFSPRSVKSLLEGCCTDCGNAISDFTLFGNALVARRAEAAFLCAKCRGLPEPLPRANVLRGHIDRAQVVVSMGEYRGSLNLRDIELVLALRTNYAMLQDRRTHREAFDVKVCNSAEDMLLAEDLVHMIRYVPPVQTQYGNLDSIGNCAECGARWGSRQYRVVENTRSSGSGEGKASETQDACWACGCPDEAQWNMRCTLEEEIGLLSEWSRI